MLRRRFVSAGFPVFLLGLLAAERVAAWLLGIYPSSAALWAASLELRSLFRDCANWLEGVSGHSLILQIGMLATVAVAVLAATSLRCWAALSFLANHAALILVAAMTVLSAAATVASSSPDLAPTEYLLKGGLQLAWTQLFVLALGLLACLACHLAVLAEARGREQHISSALRELAFDLEGRRLARRSTPLRSR